jgi:hypothetical protein
MLTANGVGSMAVHLPQDKMGMPALLISELAAWGYIHDAVSKQRLCGLAYGLAYYYTTALQTFLRLFPVYGQLASRTSKTGWQVKR